MSERVEKLKAAFMGLREKDVSFEKMAEMFGVSRCTVYANLQAIADLNNIKERSSLLYVPHKPHNSTGVRRIPAELDAVDIDDIGALFTTLIDTCDELVAKIDTILKNEGEEKNA